ncbi:MAG: acetyl-CoA hydrolase/transferase family protein [Syntrophomonadaceae bacterium]|jgi:butyryl-CoA:acetate CoA-transferase
MREFLSEYKNKLITADQAAALVKSGDYLEWGYGQAKPIAIDHALAKRKDELFNVHIHNSTSQSKFAVFEADQTGEHFDYYSGHLSTQERKYVEMGFATYIPSMLAQNSEWLERGWRKADITMIQVGPMDKHGYFNFGPQGTFLKTCCDVAKIVVVEVNHLMPRALGGRDESIHISEVDYIVEDPLADRPLATAPRATANEVDKKIAQYLVEEIEDGSCIQIGIGSIPDLVGNMIANSDIKNLGIHTEMFTTAMADMYLAGKVTGRKKNIDTGKMVYSFAFGAEEVYEILDNNPDMAMFPCSYTNQPYIIMKNDRAVSINSCLEVDLTGQVCSESVGTRQISGSGGQLEFALGAYFSRGGKSFICFSSTYTSKDGQVLSRIKPTLTPGAVVTTPRPVVHYLVSEHGKVILKGKSVWERAEMIISLAAPQFRDELIKEAQKIGIWKRTNKIV